MSETTRIADELRRAFDGEAWHGESLFEILRGVPATRAAAHPIHNAHSIWELVLHIAAWEGAVRKRMTGVNVTLSDGQNFPSVLDTSDAAWKNVLAHVRHVHEDLLDTLSKFPDARLTEQVPGKLGTHYNFYFMFHGLSQHAAYHAGQIALMKSML
jgi:uncharacterized damage-inducible protein DinB